ncbi:MAG: hypothetical protein BMS9Abin05_0802 [Rhodothermia bacterium]|nr:MAG: hypothetical protein BMS9Abin05_0802 [Rhodothermia bacterium]
MPYRSNIARIVVLFTTLLALVPLGQMVNDWYEVSQFEELLGTRIQSSASSYDWMEWEDVDGRIVAGYVFPNGPAAKAGIQEGDQFYMLEFQQYFDTEGLRSAISGIRPGEVRNFLVVRGDEYVDARVRFARHPTFLYPRSLGLWRLALWGFTLGSFFHILGLFIAGPLASRFKKARFELVLIAVSSAWIVGNLLRLLLVEFWGPPNVGTAFDDVFQALTFIGLVGWIGFPVLLLHKVIVDGNLAGTGPFRKIHTAAYFTPFLLLVTVLITAVYGHLGPVTLEDLLIPILFYASCYIAAASLLVFISYVAKDELSGQLLGEWGRTGSAAILFVAIVVALVVTGVIPVLAGLSDATAGWIIVGAQLIAVAPVTLFSFGTLRHGKVDDVVTRALVYVLVLGLIFLAFVGGLTLMESTLANSGNSRVVLEGLYVVFLLILFERFARRLRVFASSFFSTERHKARQKLTRFQAEMTDILDAELLAQSTINVVGKVFKANSAILFLPSTSGKGRWVTGRYHPEAPYLTERIFHTVWPHFKDHPTIWARNRELNENTLPDELSGLLEDHHAALAIPIRQEGEARGLLVLGRKSRRRSVYNLDDLEQMRSLSSHLALAVERLALIDRERQLAKESTNAHLVALRAQINPHFLFNALNTILALIEERPDEAEGVVEDLAAIFRHTLTTGSQPFVSLEEEFTLVDCYLKIEQARFGDRLSVECYLDPEIANVPVPAFAVQTIVENAIKHGLEKQRKKGTLSLSCTRLDEGHSLVVVSDSGVGIPALFGESDPAEGIASFFGIGLTNVASRLEQHYGRRDLLKFESDSESGTTVTLLIPEKNHAPYSDH